MKLILHSFPFHFGVNFFHGKIRKIYVIFGHEKLELYLIHQSGIRIFTMFENSVKQINFPEYEMVKLKDFPHESSKHFKEMFILRISSLFRLFK